MEQRLGRLSLRADAAYCALAAFCLLIFVGPLARAMHTPIAVLIVASGATAVWALILRFAAHAPDVRPWLRGVLAANTAAAGWVALLAVTRPSDAMAFLLLAVAIEVAAFAVIQAVALRRPL